ncbi:PREDICTED: uncharacterized protein LOC106814112 [Priapulus caudatus]|uniref:Uncharacterized protein LOC106814112 n=1 Tax=Priapulus caudatus TaxID=37621 RepID=A0ABM1ENV4_PRICU|nr:PREDICTED: uncharacterized protein LOC106814112 [Priapulus caudatus]
MGCISSKSTKDEDDSDNDKTKKPFKNGSSMRLDDVSLTHKSDANDGAASAAAQEAHKKGKGLLEELRDNKIPVDSRAERVALIAEKMFADVLLEGFSEALPWAKPIVVVIKVSQIMRVDRGPNIQNVFRF